MTSRLAFHFTAPSKLSAKTRDHAVTAVISLAHSAVTYWSCFAIDKHLRHSKNMKLLLRHGIYTCIYCVKIFSRWNIPKTRSEAKIGQNQRSGGPLINICQKYDLAGKKVKAYEP